MPHDVEALRNAQRDGEFLLDKQNSDAAPGDLGQEFSHLRDDQRREALGRLVNHDQFGIAHQAAADGQHLLFAAGEHAGLAVGAARKIGKHGEEIGKFPLPLAARVLHAEHQVLPHCQRRKNIAVLGHIAKPGAGDGVVGQAGEFTPLETDRALRRDLAHNGLERRRTPRAIAAKQADYFALLHVEVDTLQDVALAVIGVEGADGEHGGEFDPCRLRAFPELRFGAGANINACGKSSRPDCRYAACVDLAFRMPGVIGCLHPQPDSGAIAEHLAKARGHLRGNRLFLQQNIIKVLPGQPQKRGDFHFGLSCRRKKIIEDGTGMRRASRRIADSFICAHVFSSVILLKIDLAGVTIFKRNRDAPGAVHVNAVADWSKTFERMKIITRQIHIFRLGACIQTIKPD